MTVPPVVRPTLFLNEAIARRNIARMAEKATRSAVQLRPHFKTHQSAVIGEWFREVGIDAITVSSVDMAAYFINHGWQDVLIAFPVNPLELDRVNDLAQRALLGLLVESVDVVGMLAAKLTAPVDVWIKIDTGYHRTGIAWDAAGKLAAVAAAVAESEGLTLRGLLTHAGHSYAVRSADAIRAVYAETVTRAQTARDGLAAAGHDDLLLAPGDTPTCSVMERFEGIDSIRPGNFVFYDAMQVQIGSCTAADVAVAVACPVVAVHPEDQRIVVYGGGVHLSKERITADDGTAHYGLVAPSEGDGWGAPLEGVYVAGLSQEHGIIHANTALLERVKPGDLLFVLPVHSCMTANLLKQYRTTDGQIIPMMDLPH